MAGKVSVDVERIKNCFKELSSEALELYLNAEVPETDSAPSPLTFLREWVQYNRPLVVRGGVCHWPACQKWSNSYLRERLGDAPVTITCTPNGLADAPQGDLFVMPEERSSTLGDFIDIIEDKKKQEGVSTFRSRIVISLRSSPNSFRTLRRTFPGLQKLWARGQTLSTSGWGTLGQSLQCTRTHMRIFTAW